MKEVRVSELALWLRCRRRTYLQYTMGFNESGKEAGIGTAFHTMLKAYYGGDVTDEEHAQLQTLQPESAETVQAMFDTYIEEVETDGLDVGQETVEVERRFHVGIVPGFEITGQIDRIYTDPTVPGGVIIQDHKTVASTFETAQRDFQLMTYAWLAMMEGMEVGAIEHNIVKRNKRTARAKPPYIQRNRVLVTKPELDKWGRMLLHIVSDYRDAHEAAKISELGAEHPAIWAKGTNDCSWYCPFATVCGMLDSPEADWLGTLQMEFNTEEAPHEA